MYITIEIDGEAKALYVRLKDGEVAETVEYPEQQEIFLDLDAQGQLFWFSFDNITGGMIMSISHYLIL